MKEIRSKQGSEQEVNMVKGKKKIPGLGDKKVTNTLVANIGQSSDHSDFVSSGSHTSRKIVVNREDFEQFSIKKKDDVETIGNDSSITDSIIQQTKARMAKMYDEKYCFDPIIFSISEKSIQEEALENVFREKYLEGRGTPRLFVIKVQSPKAGYAVFHVYEDSNCQDTKRVCSYDDTPCVRISMTLKCSISKEQGQTVHKKLTETFSPDEPLGTVQQLMGCVENYVTAFCSPDDISKKASVKKKNQKAPELFSNLTEFNGWSVKAYNKEEALKVVASESLNNRKTTVSVSRVESTPRGDIICCICLDSISHGRQMAGYALQSCDHWFCSECWCNHLVTRVEEGDRQLSCPGHECDKEVDTATLVALMPYSYFIKYESYVYNTKLEVSREWAWCQGLHGKCEQIIRATTKKPRPNDSINETLEDRICVTCSCKTQWCFDCGKEPHWPATCKQAAHFISEAMRRGHIDYSSGATNLALRPAYKVNVKRCPKCKNPMQKNGGCLHMVCPLCRCDFCWYCLMPLKDAIASNSVEYNPRNPNQHSLVTCNRESRTEEHITLYNPHSENKHSSYETEEAFYTAISWREFHQNLIRATTKLEKLLQEWIFILQWSYVLVYVSCSMKVCNNPLKEPLEILAFCVASVSKKLICTKKGIHSLKITKKPIYGLENIKKAGIEQVREICRRIKRIQMAIKKSDDRNGSS